MSNEPTIYTAYRHIRRETPGITATRCLELARVRMDSYADAVTAYKAVSPGDATYQPALSQVSIAAGRAGAYDSSPPSFPAPAPFNDPGEDGLFWAEKAGLKHLEHRRLGYADELDSHIRHTGWFSDAGQDESYRGVVYLLPCRNAHERHYLVGYADPNNDGCARLELFVCARDGHVEAARRADQIAKREAEESREYDEHWQKNSRLAEKAGEVRDAAILFGSMRVALRQMRRGRAHRIKPVTFLGHAARLKGELAALRASLDEFAEADNEARDKLHDDPLDHESAADHDPDLVRRARQLAEMMDV